MRRFVLALALVATAGGAAFADDAHVRTSATVEVLDDKAQIDDVISRMRTQQARDKKQPAPLQQAATLKVERPAPPTTTQDSQHRPVGPEPKEQRTGSRRVNLEHGSTNVTERPRLHRR